MSYPPPQPGYGYGPPGGAPYGGSGGQYPTGQAPYPGGQQPYPGQAPPAPGFGGYPGQAPPPGPGYPGTAPAFTAQGAPPPGGPGYPGQPGGYGAPPQSGYGSQPGYPQSQPGYGAPPPQQGYGAPPQQGYGAPPPQQGYGAPPQQQGYGAPPQPGYGAPQQAAYGAPAAAGYGAPGGAPYGAQPSQPYGAPAASQPPPQGGTPYQASPYGQAPNNTYQQQQQQPPPQQQQQRASHPPQAAAHSSPSHQQQTPAVQATAEQLAKMQLYGTTDQFRGTIRVQPNFDVQKETEALRKAMKGCGTDEQAMMDVICRTTNAQRQEIKRMFKTMYGKDLIHDIKSELSGDFEEIIIALFMETIYYDAWSLNRAMKGLGTDEAVLIEILCTRTNDEIRKIVQCFKKDFGRDLEKEIVSETSGHFKRTLVSCCQGNRRELSAQDLERVLREGPECMVDRARAKEDAQKLYTAGEKKVGTDESAFLTIMAINHVYQLRAIFDEYPKISGRDILNSVSREMSGDLQRSFEALIQSARNRPEFFADRLYRSMKGAGTDDSTLIRVITSRSEIDLQNIKEIFLKKYQKTLWKFIEGDTSGDYKKILIGIVGRD